MFFSSQLAITYYKENICNELYLTQSGWEICRSNHTYGPAIRDHYIIHYIASGKGKYITKDKTYYLSQGDAFLICPNDVTTYKADVIDPWEYCWFGFNGSKINELLSMVGLNRDNPIFHYPNVSFARKIEAMHNACITSVYPPITSQSHLSNIFDELISLNNKKNTTYSSGNVYAKNAINFIEYNYAIDLSIGHLADNLSIDRSYLYRVFKEETGLSPQDYLIQCRIKNACRLLQSTNLTISEISQAVGYNDSVHFSKIFKSIKNITPSKYRKNKIR